MARANTYTWLPLDTWAQLLGYDLWHFNGISHTCLARDCPGLWYQYPHHTPRLDRETLAIHIREAEQRIAGFVGYNLLPDWNAQITNPPRHHDPIYVSNVNALGMPKSVRLERSHVIAGGRKTKASIQLGVTLNTQDNDGDGFHEARRITITTAVAPEEIRVYYPGEGGSDAWEIRPIRVVSTDPDVVIDIPLYQLVKRSILDALCANDSVEASENSNFLETVDVYRVYNDPTDAVNQIYAPDPNCSGDCQEVAYTDCLRVQDERNGFVVYNSRLRSEPDKLEIFYYSGWRERSLDRPKVELDPYWATAIAYFAAGLIDREALCCGGDQSQVSSRWRDELDFLGPTSPERRHYAATVRVIENVFGIPTRGAWYAYQKAIAPGRKLR